MRACLTLTWKTCVRPSSAISMCCTACVPRAAMTPRHSSTSQCCRSHEPRQKYFTKAVSEIDSDTLPAASAAACLVPHTMLCGFLQRWQCAHIASCMAECRQGCYAHHLAVIQELALVNSRMLVAMNRSKVVMFTDCLYAFWEDHDLPIILYKARVIPYNLHEQSETATICAALACLLAWLKWSSQITTS